MRDRDGPLAIDIVTLFPEFFPGPLSTGLVGRALREGRAKVSWVDPRRLTRDRHRTVDDAPYGGGAGMVMKVEPLAAAIRIVRQRGQGPVVLLSPKGRPLKQVDLARWASGGHLGLVCGRYEGFDERVRSLIDDEVSVADVVLTGGEYGALVIVDGVVRLLPGTLGNEGSAPADSFSDGLLEFPQYTRPERWSGLRVPDVLLSGHHARIEDWRREQKLFLTRRRRPDLLEELALEERDRRVLEEAPMAREVSLAVAFSPAGLSPEDACQLEQLAAAYALERVWLVGTDIPVEPTTKMCGVADWSALRASLDSGTAVLAAGGVSYRQPVVPMARARGLAQECGLCILIGAGLEAARPDGALPGWRHGGPPHALGPVLVAALLLDRVLSEG